MATTLSGGISATIEEKLSQGVRQSLPRLDPTWKLMSDTYMGVEADGQNVGRDWKVIHTFSESLSGAFKWVDIAGGPIGDTANTSLPAHSIVPGTPRTYPGLDDATLPGYFRKTLTLNQGMGNLFVPQQYLRADKLTATVVQLTNDIIRGAAQKVAIADIAAFYSTGEQSLLGTIGKVTLSGSRATCDVQGAVNQFYNGQIVDIWNAALSAQRSSSVKVVVDGVRYVPDDGDVGYGEITLTTVDGSTFDTNTVATDVLLVQESKGFGPRGPFYWLQNTGTVFGVDLSTYQQFQSVVKGSVGSLDETKLNQYLSRLWKAYGATNFPDTILTSMGVYLALMDSSQGHASRFVRYLGERDDVKMGFDSPGETTHLFNGLKMKLIISPFMPSDSQMSASAQNGGRLWAFKARDKNIKRYLPPPIDSRRHGQFGSEVEFTHGGGGPDGIFSHYHENSRKTEWAEAPFNRFVEYCPQYMPGLNLSGIEELL